MFPVFDWFYPFSFEEGGGDKVIEDFNLAEVVVIFRVKLDWDKVGNDLICSVSDISS